jgi:hypothetical protein
MADTEIDEEFVAIQSIHTALRTLGPEARIRVLNYVSSRLEIPVGNNVVEQRKPRSEEVNNDTNGDSAKVNYDSFADLYDAANPTSSADKALVAGYWLQVCQSSAWPNRLTISRSTRARMRFIALWNSGPW